MKTLEFLFVIFFFGIHNSEAQQQYLNPVILSMKSILLTKFSYLKSCYIFTVPGNGGSQMEAKLDKPTTVNWFCDRTSDWFTLWLDLKLLVPYAADCFADNIILKYDPETRTTRNNDGVQIRIPGFGGTATVETLGQDFLTNRLGSYFRDIVESLVSIGYERGVNIHGAPYDFRKVGLFNHFESFSRYRTIIINLYYT